MYKISHTKSRYFDEVQQKSAILSPIFSHIFSPGFCIRGTKGQDEGIIKTPTTHFVLFFPRHLWPKPILVFSEICPIVYEKKTGAIGNPFGRL